jgi:hypothetical protein
MLRTRALGALKASIGIAASCASFDRPVFILAPPRSGSTLLFAFLAKTGVFHLPAEADLYWWRVWPYDRAAEPSDFIGQADVREGDLDQLCKGLYRQAVVTRLKQRGGLIDPGYLAGNKRIRYLEKTIANCFHLEVLERYFPDARFVFLVRDPRANIASMIEGWPYLERFGKPQLTPILRRIQPRSIEHWSYPAPPGWQTVVGRPLAEICAWSWQQHVEAVLAFRARHPADVLQIRYEDLITDPTRIVGELAGNLGLMWSGRAARYAQAAPLSPTIISKPAPDKWIINYRAEVETVISKIEATARAIGYDVHSHTAMNANLNAH